MSDNETQPSMNRRATIADIARAVGVSKVTVSYVLNGRNSNVKITDRTRERVFEAARQLNYTSNALAKGLANRRTKTITFVTQHPSIFEAQSAFVTELVHWVTKAAYQAGYDLLLHTRPVPGVDAEVAAIMDGRADGVLLLRDQDDPVSLMLADRSFPCVNIFGRGFSSKGVSVDVDNVRGMELAVDYLVGLGHRHLVHVAGNPGSAAAAERIRGFELAMNKHGFPVGSGSIVEISSVTVDPSIIDPIMRAEDAPPTALVSWSDDIAMIVMRHCQSALGLRIPDDLSVIGFDSTLICDLAMPRLSSVRQPIDEIARAGVNALVDMIEGRAIAQPRITYNPTLDIRSSCAPPR